MLVVQEIRFAEAAKLASEELHGKIMPMGLLFLNKVSKLEKFETKPVLGMPSNQ